MDITKFTWVPFYKELAKALLQFKDNRLSLVQWIYDELGQVKRSDGRSLVAYLHERNGDDIKDIDPFSVYGIFNRKLKEVNRNEFLRLIKSKLGLKSTLPTDYNGVTTVDARRAFFFSWDDDNPKVIQGLWDLFEKVVNGESIDAAYNRVLENGMPKFSLTICLYWVNPDKYLALDSRNREFLGKYGFPSDIQVLNYDAYSKLINQVFEKIETGEIPYSSFAEFSYNAWQETNKSSSGESSKKKNKTTENEEKKPQSVTPSSNIKYWIYAPGENAYKWDFCLEKELICIGWDELGDMSSIASLEQMRKKMQSVFGEDKTYMHSGLAVWEFSHVMNPGDIIYVKQGLTKIIGRGIVTGEYTYDDTLDEYKHVRTIKWTHKGLWEAPWNMPLKTLTETSADNAKKLDDILNGKEVAISPYTEDDFLNEVYISKEDFETLKALVLRKKNVILQGAPGVGKTFAAQRLAYAIMGKQDNNCLEQIQFHQNYSYEDFMMGYKPNDDGGFDMKYGVFYRFCKRAAADPDKKFFFIIDEINRGNLSKIFGELLMLIESDYRNKPITLSYREESFSVPANIYIIGMMNTADRSLAMIDYALRRRFSFFEMKPGFGSGSFKKYLDGIGDARLNKIIEAVVILNETIATDSSLGNGFCIGHSYFCNLASNNLPLQNIVEYDIIPMLREYWFDNDEKFRDESQKLRDALK